MTISVIIVNWNVRESLRRCLESINRYGRGAKYDVTVIDNASKDKSAEMVRQEFPECVLIANAANKGFAAAVNQGIRSSMGDIIFLLNPDTEVQENTFEKVLDEFARHPQTGVMGGRIENKDHTIQPSVRRFPTVWSQILIMLKLHHLFTFRAYRQYMAEDFDYRKKNYVEQVMGAFFAIRRDMIRSIGEFDERFFVWFEEVDFCKRAREAGWDVVYTPEAAIYHTGGQSFAQLAPVSRQLLFNQSLRRYMRKHHGIVAWTLFVVSSPISLLFALIFGLFHRRPTAYRTRITERES